jgi:molybdenum cofactor cytidylyltransferase
MIGAVVLAAGKSTRMGANKLVALLDGKPLVRHVVDAILASRARPVVVVTGNAPDAVRAALNGYDITFVHNPSFADGISTSIRTGITAVRYADGALICLGDMPHVRSADLDALIAAYIEAAGACDIVVPVHDGRRGNPVLLGRATFREVAALTGDTGARSIVERHRTRELTVDHDGIFVDIDTPDSLDANRR